MYTVFYISKNDEDYKGLKPDWYFVKDTWTLSKPYATKIEAYEAEYKYDLMQTNPIDA